MAWIADCSTFLRVGQKLKIMLQYKLLTKYHQVIEELSLKSIFSHFIAR